MTPFCAKALRAKESTSEMVVMVVLIRGKGTTIRLFCSRNSAFCLAEFNVSLQPEKFTTWRR